MPELNKRDKRFREKALKGNLWIVILTVGIPLALFNCLNSLFNIIDTFIASSVSTASVSTVSYLNQLQATFMQIGTGLAAGGSLLISNAYGSGDYEKVTENVSTLLTISMCLGLGFLTLIPFSAPILRFLGTPELFVVSGSEYFATSLFGIVISFFNSVYLAIERARGNTRRILALNMVVITLKLVLSYIFIHRISSDILMIAVAGVISQTFLLIFSVKTLFFTSSSFAFNKSYIRMEKKTLKPLFEISLPIVIEKCAFTIGKTIVNNMCAFYGENTIGALGISNNLNGVYNNAQTGMQDATSSVISQNMGAGNYRRARSSFFIVLVLNFIISVIGYTVLMTFIIPVSRIFSTDSAEFGALIIRITNYGAIGAFALFLSSSVAAFLFGIGKTKLTLLINFCRIFLFRVPVLFYMQNFTDLGAESAGIIMLVSNIATSMLALGIVIKVMHDIRKGTTVPSQFQA